MGNFIANQFRKPSGLGGRIVSFLMKRGNSFAYDKIIEELDIKQNDHILEIGYGHGIGIDRICNTFDCRITGIDFSELMHKEATKRNRKHLEKKKVSLNFGDYLTFTCNENAFDKIYFTNVIYFWNKIETPFRKIRNELKSDGVFCFFMAQSENLRKMKFTTDDVFNKYEIEYVVKELENAGFRDIKYKLDGGYFVKCRK